MAEATHRIGNVHGPADPVSASLAADANGVDLVWDVNLYRKPDYFVYIYTVSDRPFVVSQPPLFPKLNIPAKKKGERYGVVCKLPSPFNQPDHEGGVGDLIMRAHMAERVAQSICNPNNTSLDQDAVPPENTILGLGVDLNAQGVFWSKNNPPTEEELAKAERRRERYYNGLLERARTLEISNPRELENSLNQDYHMAAEYFGVETSWHKKLVRFETCPLCGGSMPPGVAIHAKPAGCGGVIDWDRAIAAGLKKESDRPQVSSRGGE